MKKIILLFAAVCMLFGCDSEQEDIKNGGHITVDELKAKSTVTVDKDANGRNGNVITCSTSAPVNAKWDIGGKELTGNYAWKKMKVGEHLVTEILYLWSTRVGTGSFLARCLECRRYAFQRQ